MRDEERIVVEDELTKDGKRRYERVFSMISMGEKRREIEVARGRTKGRKRAEGKSRI